MKPENIKTIFENQGYYIYRNFLSPKECATFLKTIKKYANDACAPIMNPDRLNFLIPQTDFMFKDLNYLGEKANLVNSMQKDCKYFRSLMLNKKILNTLKKIKGKDCSCLMSQMIFKQKNTKYSLQSWLPHQDNSYVLNKKGHYITINIFMEKSNTDNGTLYIYEDSHKHGILKFQSKKSYREKDNKPGNVVLDLRFKKKDLIFKKGDMLIMHGNLVHGSYPNKSKKLSRPLYSVSYIPKGEKFISGLNAQRKVLN